MSSSYYLHIYSYTCHVLLHALSFQQSYEIDNDTQCTVASQVF